METQMRDQVIQALKATTSAENQGAATKYLEEASKMIGFAQVLLDVTNDEHQELAVRQAAVIYLKNLINKSWVLDEEDQQKMLPLSEQDKVPIREKIVDGVIRSPEPIRVHLCSCIQFIMRSDFPNQWPNLIEKVLNLLHTHDGPSWLGALLIIHRLTKIYEYKRQKDKTPLVNAMHQILPILYDRFTRLLTDESQESCLLQKIILKIFYCLIQFSLNPAMISIEAFDQWLSLFLTIVQRDVTANLENLDEEEKAQTIWWKCKKWALKNITRIFERYGAKGQVETGYQAYAEHYFQRFAENVINSLLKILADHMNGVYVSERVLYLALSHMSEAASHSELWKIMKPHFQEMTQVVLFPMLHYTEIDEEMWDEDPESYVRAKHDIFEELHNPASSAASLLQAASKRVGMMMPILNFVITKLSDAKTSEKDIDASMNMVGILALNLIKNKKYKKDVEKLIHSQVFTRLNHSQKFIRARACWVIKEASETPYSNQRILHQVVDGLCERLIKDSELPVKVEAAIAIQHLLQDQEGKISTVLKPHIREVMIEILRLLTKTKVDDLTPVVDQIIERFQEDVIPFAYDVATELVELFHKLTVPQEEDEMMEDNTVTVMGILATLETLLALVEEKPEILTQVEDVVGRCIVSVFENFSADYFEEILSLTQSLTTSHVTQSMWGVYPMIYETFLKEDSGFFGDAMPTLHNYLTVDTTTFLSKPDHIHWLLDMCQRVLNDKEAGDEPQEYAAKMLECFVLQCQGKIDSYIPHVLTMAMTRLGGEFEEHSGELKAQLLTVFLACLYYNIDLFLHTLASLQQPNIVEWFFNEVMVQNEQFLGIHNRKLLIYGLMAALRLPAERRPLVISQNPTKVTEVCLSLFAGIQKCIKAIAENRAEEDSSSDEESDDEDDLPGRKIDDEIRDSDDDVDEGTLEYLESLEADRKKEKKSGVVNGIGDAALIDELGEFHSDSDDSEDHHDFVEETALEDYDTPIDSEETGLNIFVVFKKRLEEIQQADPALFMQLTSGLNQVKAVELQELFTQCNKQEELENSKQLARSGGYVFDASAPVPTAFNFSSQ